MASLPPAAATLQERPVKQAPKYVPREDVRILPHPLRGRGQESVDSPEPAAPRMSGETLVELWDAPIEETLPDSKLAKEIIASRTSPVFSPKMGHVRTDSWMIS